MAFDIIAALMKRLAVSNFAEKPARFRALYRDALIYARYCISIWPLLFMVAIIYYENEGGRGDGIEQEMLARCIKMALL